MTNVPHDFDECVHTDDFSKYATEHRAEHDKLHDKLEKHSVQLGGVETQLRTLIATNRLILGAVVTGIISLLLVLLTRGI